MGQQLSQEQVQAHLARQETLIKQLQKVVDRQAAELAKADKATKGLEAAATTTAQEIDNVDLFDDEIRGLESRVYKAERRKQEEETITAEEQELPDTEWTEPSEEEAKTLLSSKPWLATMAKPTGFEYKRTDGKPDVTLELEHVYGFRSNEVRSNLFWVDEETIMYVTGCVGIVHNLTTNTQKFFRGHSDDIVSIAYHPARRLVVTGEQGKFPSACVWSVDTCKQAARLAGFHRRAVVGVDFSADGSHVVSVGLNDECQVAVYNWSSGLCVASAKAGGGNRVIGVKFVQTNNTDGNTQFVTYGVNHLKFWTFDGSNFASKDASLGGKGVMQGFLCAASTPQHVVVGTQSGDLYCFQNGKLVKNFHAHQTCVNSIYGTRELVFTGGRDGFVSSWSTNTFEKIHCVNVNKAHEPETLKSGCTSIRAIDVIGRDDPVMIASTLAGTICRINLNDGACAKVVQAHTGDLQKARAYGELGGLATTKDGTRFATTGEDRTVRIWDSATRNMVKKQVLTARAQSLAWSPDGQWLAAGLQDGRCVIVDKDGNEVMTFKCSRRRVQCLRFTPDSSKLAVGVADTVVQLYDATNEFAALSARMNTNSVPLAIDFSEDGTKVQVCTQSYELVFFNVEDGAAVENPLQAAKDIKWASFSSILGWDVQGIWPKGSDGSDVNTVCRSSNQQFLASGEDHGTVKLFRYPCVGSGLDREGGLARRPDCHRFTGHSEHITGVQWHNNDQYLLTTGGFDNSIFQWKLVPLPAADSS